MARCGCANTGCACAIIAGDGITVTGTGDNVTPYVVSIDPLSGDTVSDTPTVNMSKVGNNISADVTVDPVGGNTLAVGPGGLSVPCEAIQDCVGAAFGNGLIYDDALNQMRARISATGGNTMMFGPDGGLYAAAGAFSCDSLNACPIGALADVDMTFAPPVANDLMYYDGTNWVRLPAGCGLTVSAAGLNLDTTPFANLTRRNASDTSDIAGTTALVAGCNLQGQQVYCDSDGNIRTKPEKLALSRIATVSQTFAPAQVIPFQTADLVLTLTNPSTCYAMCGVIVFAANIQETSQGGSNPQTFYSYDLGDGAGFVETNVFTKDTRGVSSIAQTRNRMPLPLNLCLDPGETKNVTFRVRWAQGPFVVTGQTQILDAQREIRYFGVNI